MSKWKTPVELTIHGTGHQTVHGPYAAAMLLMISWPAKHGSERERAEHICLEAVDGLVDGEEAREAFLSAAKEAGLIVQDERATFLAA